MATKPDIAKRLRNHFAAASFASALLSYIFIISMKWWILPVDSWLMLASLATGISSLILFLIACISHFEYLDATRSN